MSGIEAYPPRYYQYLATQRRVSNWVKQSGSIKSQRTSQIRRPGSKRNLIPESVDAVPHEYASVHRRSSKRHSPKHLRRHSEAREDKTAISPAVALVSSSFFVWALLPSILTLSAFVIVLSFASLNDGVYSLLSALQLFLMVIQTFSRRFRCIAMPGVRPPMTRSRGDSEGRIGGVQRFSPAMIDL